MHIAQDGRIGFLKKHLSNLDTENDDARLMILKEQPILTVGTLLLHSSYIIFFLNVKIDSVTVSVSGTRSQNITPKYLKTVISSDADILK